MHAMLRSALAVGTLIIAAPALAADPCQLVPAASVTALIGADVKGSAAGPEKDDDSGGQMTFCNYRGTAKPVGLIVSIIEFASEAAARKQLTTDLVESQIGDDEAKVTEEGGIGDKSYYAATPKGSMYVFLKKSRIVGVALGGPGAGDAKATKPALLAAAQAAASRI
jgi:hypothetical protein